MDDETIHDSKHAILTPHDAAILQQLVAGKMDNPKIRLSVGETSDYGGVGLVSNDAYFSMFLGVIIFGFVASAIGGVIIRAMK
jgi:hypothetical protein